MADTSASEQARTGRRHAKREAIERAARDVFARFGYPRASIDLIAAEAEVSTRTIYKHFGDKLQLFASVLIKGATEVADTFSEQVDSSFTGTDPEADLTVLARAIVAHRMRFPKHFALVARISADRDHFPAEIIDAWLKAGPMRVRAVIINHLEQLRGAGHLHIADPQTAARHLIALASSATTTEPLSRSHPTDTEIITAVHAFMHGYAESSGTRA